MEQKGVLVVFQSPDLKFIPMAEAINEFRTIPENSEFISITRSWAYPWAIKNIICQLKK